MDFVLFWVVRENQDVVEEADDVPLALQNLFHGPLENFQSGREAKWESFVEETDKRTDKSGQFRKSWVEKDLAKS